MPDGGVGAPRVAPGGPVAPGGLGRLLLGPALGTAAMLLLLLGLGVWQVRRLAWKEGLLAQEAAAAAAAPVPLPAHPVLFQRVQVSGRLLPDLRLRFGADVRDTPRGPVLGEQLIVPLGRADGPPVLVDLGWVPEGVTVALPTDPVTVTGFVRDPEHPGWLSPHDDARQRRFYTLDPVAMGAALGLPEVAPLTLVATGAPAEAVAKPGGRAQAVAGAAPVPVGAPPELPNNHLTYALTWFGLAGTLVAVFATWVARTVPGAPAPGLRAKATRR